VSRRPPSLRRVPRSPWPSAAVGGALLLLGGLCGCTGGAREATGTDRDSGTGSPERDASDDRRADGGPAPGDAGPPDAVPADATPADAGNVPRFDLAGPRPDAADLRDAGPPPADLLVPPTDSGDPPTPVDAGDGGAPPLGPPAARPPQPAPDRRAVVQELAAEHPDWLAGSCTTAGGTLIFLHELVRRLRSEDRRWGLVRRDGRVKEDLVGYFWGDGHAEGATELYALDVIQGLCPRPGIDPPARPGWLDTTAPGDRWTLAGYPDEPFEPRADAGLPPDPEDAGPPPPVDGGDAWEPLPLPNGLATVRAVAAEHPDWLSGSCVPQGGDNAFLFAVVQRLRATDRRWGLNWKRGVVGDLSQDVVDYYHGPGEPSEGATEVHIVDVIADHCGEAPRPAWTDVTAATASAGTIGRWTLAGQAL